MNTFDTIIIGAGAAGLIAAARLCERGKSVIIIDMGNNAARKIAVSGGGRCNFTNTRADYTHYFGKNPRFIQSALSKWSPTDTLNWVKSHNIDFYEKDSGRYFCKNSAMDIVNALLMDARTAKMQFDTNVSDIEKNNDIFTVKSDHGNFMANSVIVANGGMSYAHLGVSNIGQKIAKKFGHKIEPIRPALCAMKTEAFDDELAGISLPVEIIIGKNKIREDLLFTHFGIGGPATYRASLFDVSEMIINFAPDINIFDLLKTAKQKNGKKAIANIIGDIIPNKLARFLCGKDTRNIADFRDIELKSIANKINHFEIIDAKNIGFQSAEITIGGISTDEISSKTMESKLCNGLYFAGETMDIAGDLGGYNIQWAFSSGHVAGTNA